MAKQLQLGAEPKKVAILGVLLAVFAAVLYWNTGSEIPEPGGGAPLGTTRPAASGPATLPAPVRTAPRAEVPRRTPASQRNRLAEFRPSLKAIREAAVDPAQLDPTLKLDALTRLQAARYEGGNRSLFDFSSVGTLAAAAKIPQVKPVKPAFNPDEFVGPRKPEPEPPKPKPQAPPIPLKYYGFVQQSKPGPRRGFFLDGEDILVAAEGETVRNRYKVVRIGLTSVEMEDIEFKQTQTLPLVQENQGS
jgi:hypothetical protein